MEREWTCETQRSASGARECGRKGGPVGFAADQYNLQVGNSWQGVSDQSD